MYSAYKIAEYIIWYYNSIEWVVSNLKLQKLLYFLQAEFLVEKNKALFDDDIIAWDFGPVVPKVYKKYAIYGGASIPYLVLPDKPILRKEDEELINEVLNYFKDYTSTDLVTLTQHQMPWMAAYYPKENCVITKRSIKEYFAS
jgi:uncharacterized phage-associated protein